MSIEQLFFYKPLVNIMGALYIHRSLCQDDDDNPWRKLRSKLRAKLKAAIKRLLQIRVPMPQLAAPMPGAA